MIFCEINCFQKINLLQLITPPAGFRATKWPEQKLDPRVRHTRINTFLILFLARLNCGKSRFPVCIINHAAAASRKKVKGACVFFFFWTIKWWDLGVLRVVRGKKDQQALHSRGQTIIDETEVYYSPFTTPTCLYVQYSNINKQIFLNTWYWSHFDVTYSSLVLTRQMRLNNSLIYIQRYLCKKLQYNKAIKKKFPLQQSSLIEQSPDSDDH